MNFELYDNISKLLSNDRLDDAIPLAEEKLREQVPTDFNKLLGRNLLQQTDKLVVYFSDFYDKVKGNLDIKAIYGEMNGFTINWDLWFIELFAYDRVGGTDDTDWLADWEEENSTLESFPLTGYEDLQTIYQDFIENKKYKDSKINAAGDVAELLIVLRLQELVRAVTRTAKQKKLPWATIPIFATAHDYYDIVYKAN